MQTVCQLFAAQLHLQEGDHLAAAASVAAAETIIAALPEQGSTAVNQLRLHALVLTTLRQLAAGEMREVLQTGERQQPKAQQGLLGMYVQTFAVLRKSAPQSTLNVRVRIRGN